MATFSVFCPTLVTPYFFCSSRLSIDPMDTALLKEAIPNSVHLYKSREGKKKIGEKRVWLNDAVIFHEPCLDSEPRRLLHRYKSRHLWYLRLLTNVTMAS